MPSSDSRRRLLRTLMPEWTSPMGEPESAALSIVRSPQSSMPSMGLRLDRRRAGTFMLDHNLLLIDREELRQAGTEALERAGFTVRPPLRPAEVGEGLLRLDVRAIGSWGNTLLFRSPVPDDNISLAVYDMDAAALLTVSTALIPGITRLLELISLPVAEAGTSTVPRLREKLSWDDSVWVLRPPSRGVRRSLTPQARASVPPEVADAVDKVLAVPVKNLFNRRETKFWESQHGVLDDWDLSKVRSWDSSGIILPDGWRELWDEAIELSAPHVLSLTALALHDAHPQWWESIDASGIHEATNGVWLLGHSDSYPEWMRRRHDRVEEDRMMAVVAALVSEAGDLSWLRPASRKKRDCWMCGREFELGMHPAGRIAKLRMTTVCHLCLAPDSQLSAFAERDDVLARGAAAAVAETVRLAGRVISASMVDDLSAENLVSPEVFAVLRHALPRTTELAWGKWLQRAGVIGEGWRPSYGYISTANDGHGCRSLFERIVDDWMSAYDVPHDVEPPYPYDEELNPNGSRADWRLADGRFVEAAGLMTSARYAAKMVRKVELAQKYDIPLLVLTEKDLPRLAELLR